MKLGARNVKAVNLGDRPVKRVMLGDRLAWPAEQPGPGPDDAIRGVTSVAVDETNTTLAIPSGTQPGDVMLVFVSHTGATLNALPPTGWQRYAIDTSAEPNFYAFFKEYEEGDGNQVTFATGGPRQRVYHLVVLAAPTAFNTRAEARGVGTTSHATSLLVGCEDTVQQLVVASVAADTTLTAAGFTLVSEVKSLDHSLSTYVGVRDLVAGVHDTTPTVDSGASGNSVVLTLAFTSKTVTPAFDVLDHFDAYAVGDAPTGWTRQQSGTSTPWEAIAEATAGDGRALRRQALPDASVYGLTLDALASEPDAMVATRVRASSATNIDAVGIALRTVGVSGYRATLARAQSFAGVSNSHCRTKIERVTGASSATSLAEQFQHHEVFDYAANEWVMGAAKVSGQYLMASFWPDGRPMPALWHVAVKDESVAAGAHGVSAKRNNHVDFDWVGFKTE